MMKKKTAIIIISYLSCAVVALGVIAYSTWNRAKLYQNSTAMNYQHAFSELGTALSEIDTALQKSVYARGPAMESAVCAEIFGKAMTAQMALGVLPFSTQELEQTAGFISKVGDYAFCMTRAAAGSGLTDEQRESLKGLSGTASLLADNIRQLQTDISDGRLTMDELEQSEQRMDQMEGEALPNLSDSMKQIESEFPETPSLIYDGPFSEHLTYSSQKMLDGRDTIGQEEGREKAAEFLGASVSRIYPAGSCEGKMPAWYYSARVQGNEFSIAVSKTGGEIISFIGSREPAEGDVSIEEAVKTAREFLERRGFSNMKESYYIRQGNILTVNFAYEQNGVLCYPDLVKVGVAMDSGGVCLYEARGYLNAHCERQLPEVAVSVDDARQLVSEELEILSEGLTVIPTDGGVELLCHEFKCKTQDDRHYIIYVNAVSGHQEKVLILIEDENGALTL